MRPDKRLGDGARGDLIAFCGACHLDVENFLRRRRCAQQRPIRADVSCMRDALAKLFDPTHQESAVLSHRSNWNYRLFREAWRREWNFSSRPRKSGSV
jgi:hypothetical protein